MIIYPNAKINIGLNITEKRNDGFHNIETIFYPISLCDIIEFEEKKVGKTILETSGGILDILPEENIVLKAYNKIKKINNIPELHFYLHKIIPSGAGLGGGSSDSSAVLNALNNHFNLSIDKSELHKIALELGSDCPFFLENEPMFGKGKGELLTPSKINLKGYSIIIVKPNIFISTKEAYENITPRKSNFDLNKLYQHSVDNWKNIVRNDFEENLPDKFNEIRQITEGLYLKGAKLSMMTGSGSSVFGIFENLPKEEIFPDKDYFIWKGEL